MEKRIDKTQPWKKLPDAPGWWWVCHQTIPDSPHTYRYWIVEVGGESGNGKVLCVMDGKELAFITEKTKAVERLFYYGPINLPPAPAVDGS